MNNQAAVLGFVGSPWTLATYIIEGGSSSLYKNIKVGRREGLGGFLCFVVKRNSDACSVGAFSLHEVPRGLFNDAALSVGGGVGGMCV